MQLSVDQRCWLLSILLHTLFLLLLLLMGRPTSKIQPIKQEAIAIQMVHAPSKTAATAHPLVSKKAKPSAKKHIKPTSLPGDQPSPSISKHGVPIYPKTALNNDWEGTVKVKVTVSSTGKANRIRVLSSSGHPVLDKAFIRSIKQQYEFRPKRSMGKNQIGTIILSHTFSLKGST